MPTKHTDPTLGKLGDDEPIFVLRAQDILAPRIVQGWIDAARVASVNPQKIASAETYLADMMRWRAEHRRDVKVPD